MGASQEDELPLNPADGYLDLLKQKSILDHVWSGFKFTCLFLSLVCTMTFFSAPSLVTIYLEWRKNFISRHKSFETTSLIHIFSGGSWQFLSIYSIHLTQSVDMRRVRSEIQTLKSKVSVDQEVESNLLSSLRNLSNRMSGQDLSF